MLTAEVSNCNNSAANLTTIRPPNRVLNFLTSFPKIPTKLQILRPPILPSFLRTTAAPLLGAELGTRSNPGRIPKTSRVRQQQTSHPALQTARSHPRCQTATVLDETTQTKH